MTKFVLVEAINTFRMRYVVQLNDNDPAEWAMDTVAMEDADEFTQEAMGETILGCRVVTDQEAVDYYNEINSDFPIESCERFVTPWICDE